MSEVGKDVEREVLFVFATSVSKVSGNCILFLCFSEKLTQSQTPLHLQIDIPRPCSASREAGEEEAGQSSWGSRKKLGRHRNHPAPRHIAQFLASSWTSLFLHLCQHLWIEYLFKENVICFCATSHGIRSKMKRKKHLRMDVALCWDLRALLWGRIRFFGNSFLGPAGTKGLPSLVLASDI